MEIAASLLFFAIAFVSTSLKFVVEHERLVVFRYGRLVGVKGPGAVFVFPVVETFKKVDMRVTTAEMQIQNLQSSDNEVVQVAPVCFLKVEDPQKVVTEVADPYAAVDQLFSALLRKRCSGMTAAEILQDKDKIESDLCSSLNQTSQVWGLSVNSVEFTEVKLLPRARASEVISQAAWTRGEYINPFPLAAHVNKTLEVPAETAPQSVPGQVSSITSPLLSPVLPQEIAAGAESSRLEIPDSPDITVSEVSEQTEISLEPEEISQEPAQITPDKGEKTEDTSLETGVVPVVSAESSLYSGYEYTPRVPDFTQMNLNDTRNSDYELFMATLSGGRDESPESEGDLRPGPAGETAPIQGPVSLSETLKSAVTGVVDIRQCSSCSEPLEGSFLCFKCWSMN